MKGKVGFPSKSSFRKGYDDDADDADDADGDDRDDENADDDVDQDRVLTRVSTTVLMGMPWPP